MIFWWCVFASAAVSSSQAVPDGQVSVRAKAADQVRKGIRSKPLAANALTLIVGFSLGIVVGEPLKDLTTSYETVTAIPEKRFDRHDSLRCRVEKASDGDTLRVKHLGLTGRGEKKTLVIRIYAVDAPETPKFGKPGQPFCDEATAMAKKLVGRTVNVKLLSRDRYGRAVARVTYYENFKKRDLSDDLLQAGLARVYRAGGAQYDGRKEFFDRVEKEAQAAKRGIWSIPRNKYPPKYAPH